MPISHDIHNIEYLDGPYELELNRTDYTMWLTQQRLGKFTKSFVDNGIILKKNDEYWIVYNRKMESTWRPRTDFPKQSELAIKLDDVKYFEAANSGIDPRREKTYLSTIGALLEYISTNNTNDSEAMLIRHIESKYPKSRGLKKRTLERIFKDSKTSLQSSK